MDDRYLPPSDFLNSVLSNEISFGDSEFGRANLQRLLGFVSHQDTANRDWAVFLISGLPFDNQQIRNALLTGAEDIDPDVRDEAIVGLARRDKAMALELLHPLLKQELGIVLLEAAAIIGDPSLVPALKEISTWEGGNEKSNKQLELALSACENGIGLDIPNDELEAHHRLSDSDET